MSKKIIIANWKMHPTTVKEAGELFDFSAKNAPKAKELQLIFCPPFLYLSLLKEKLQTTNYKLQIFIGSQNTHWEDKGAFTGEVSPAMLKDLGIEYVVIGHSERRYKFGETDVMVNQKVKAVLKHGLKPVIAVGERERTNFDPSGKMIPAADDTVIHQVEAALKDVPVSKFRSVTFAYEPVWAIGTGLADNPDDALSVALLIRKTVAKLSSMKIAQDIPVLYGGSVDSKNVASYVDQEGIDGVLVGGASVKKEEFVKLLHAVAGSQ